VRLALIGCGWIVERGHVPAILRAEGVDVAAVADVAPERAKLVGRLLGLREQDCVSDYEVLLGRAEVDAVSIATPPNTHREIVAAAAEAKKHIVCEKPLATTLADADAIRDDCDRNGVLCAVYHNYLYFAETMKARELIESGEIGEVVATEISGLGARPWMGADEYRPGWRYQLSHAGGGALMDAGVHGLYLTEAYHGRTVDAVTAVLRFDDGGVDRWAFSRLELGDGVGLVNIAWGEGGAALTVMGTKGHIAFVFDEGVGYYGYPARAVRLLAEGGMTRTWYMPYERGLFSPRVYEDLAAAVAGHVSRYPAYAEHGRKALEIALASYKAHEVRATVDLPLDPADPVYTHGLAALREPALEAS
jgi:predicted dehydrogenase